MWDEAAVQRSDCEHSAAPNLDDDEPATRVSVCFLVKASAGITEPRQDFP